MDCTITTPEELVFDGAANSVTVPAADGEMGILPRHAPLVGTLGHGEVRVSEESGTKHRFFVDGGFVQVLGDRVTVLAVNATTVDDLDPAVEQQALDALEGSKPPAGASFEEREEHDRRVASAKARVRLASR